METLPQKCARIVDALDDLARQEATAVRGRDFAAAVELADRAGALVDFLSAHAAALTDPAVRQRVLAIKGCRGESVDWLEGEIARVRAELQETTVARRRVAQFAPVYGRSGPARPQLSAVG